MGKACVPPYRGANLTLSQLSTARIPPEGGQTRLIYMRPITVLIVRNITAFDIIQFSRPKMRQVMRIERDLTIRQRVFIYTDWVMIAKIISVYSLLLIAFAFRDENISTIQMNIYADPKIIPFTIIALILVFASLFVIFLVGPIALIPLIIFAIDQTLFGFAGCADCCMAHSDSIEYVFVLFPLIPIANLSTYCLYRILIGSFATNGMMFFVLFLSALVSYTAMHSIDVKYKAATDFNKLPCSKYLVH